MTDNWVKKDLVIVVIFLFVAVGFQPVFAVENKISVINNQSEKNKSYVDPNIHLTRSNLPILKRSFDYFRNSNYYDVEIGKVMEQIIKLIESKGSVNTEDVKNILIKNEITSVDTHVFCIINGEGEGEHAVACVFPFFLLEFLSLFLTLFSYYVFFGIGEFLYWHVDWYGAIRVGFKIYTGEHKGYAFGYFGIGLLEPPIFGGYLSYVTFYPSFALIAFVRT